jgi:hypothetical protein
MKLKSEQSPFTVLQAFGLQAQHIMEWKERLNPECFAHVMEQALLKNIQLAKVEADGPPAVRGFAYDVCRGQDIDSLVRTYSKDSQS